MVVINTGSKEPENTIHCSHMSSLEAYHPQFLQKEYAGFTAFINGADRPSRDDVEADIEGEQETLPDLLDDDINPPPEPDDDGEPIPTSNTPANNLSRSQLEQTVAGVSKGVADTTEIGYLRYFPSYVSLSNLTHLFLQIG